MKLNPLSGKLESSPNLNYKASVNAVQRNLKAKAAENVSVLDYGGDPTGLTDSSEAFNRALDENPSVFVPANCTFLLNQPIRIQDSNKSLIGSGNTSILKINPRGWFKDSCFLFARATSTATIPTSGTVTLQLSGAYRYISDPHNNVVTPATDLPNATNIILGRGKQVEGTLKGVSGTLARNLAGSYIFTPNPYPENPVSVVEGDVFSSTSVAEPCGGMITILSWGTTAEGDRITRNTTVRSLRFIGLTYQDLVAQFGATVATSYDLNTWKGSRRMPKHIYSDYVDGVTIEDCYFERHSHEGIWFAGQGAGRSNDFIVRHNTFKDVGYEPTNNTPLPALQCNFTNAIVSDNLLYRSGTAIGGSGASLLITNNKILGFAGDGISWGDNDCYDVTISNNHIYCDETNIPLGSSANNPDRTALNGFFSGENAPYRNMVCKGNSIRLKNVQGIGIRVSSPFEAEITANKIWIENPPENNAVGIKIQNVSDHGTLETYINQNNITYEGLTNNANLVNAIRIISSNTNIVNAYFCGNTIAGLINNNSNHWAILTDNSGGGNISYFLNGDKKTSGLIKVHGRLINDGYPDKTPLYLSASTLTTTESIKNPVYLDNSTVAIIRSISIAQGQTSRYFSSSTADASTNAQGSGMLLVTLQYKLSRLSKTYFVSTSFDNNLTPGTWYKLSPLFSTDNAYPSVDLLVSSADSGMKIDLAVCSELSGNTNVSMTVLPLSGLLCNVQRIDSTPFATPQIEKWSFYDGLIKVGTSGQKAVASLTSASVKVPMELGGAVYYASATDQNDLFSGIPPFSTTNLQLWLESDRGVLTDGTAGTLTVPTWGDNSAGIRNAIQATKSNQFIYVRNALNGIPVLRADSTGDGRKMSVPSFSLSNGITLIALIRLTTISGFSAILTKTTGSGATPFDMFTSAGKFVVAGSTVGQTTAITAGRWHIFSVTHDKTNIAYYLDGLPDGTATGGWGGTDDGNVIIGSRDDGFSKLNGDLAGLIVYNGVDNTARVAVEQYFKQKRGF